MRASRPTAVPVWSETQNLFVGAGFIPPGEPCAAAGSGGMGASRPTVARKAAAVPVWPQTQNLFVGAGFIPPGEPCAAAGCGGMGASRPTVVRKAAAVPVWPETQNLFVGADSISARGHSRRRRASGTMQASSPTGVCCNAGPQLPGWPRHSPSSVGADSISARGHSRRRRVPGTISGLRAGPAARLASETRLRAQCKHRPLQGVVVMQGRSFPVGRRIAAVRRGPRPKNKIPQTSRRAVFQSRPPGRAPHLNSEL